MTRRPEALADLLGRERDDPREAGERDRGEAEREQIGRLRVVGSTRGSREGGAQADEEPSPAHDGEATAGAGLRRAVPVRCRARGVRREIEEDADADDHPPEPGDTVERAPGEHVHQDRPRREEQSEERPHPG